MKHTLLIITALMLVVGCSSDKEPIDEIITPITQTQPRPWSINDGAFPIANSTNLPDFPATINGYRHKPGLDFWGKPYKELGTVRVFSRDGWTELYPSFPNTMNRCHSGVFMVRWRSLNPEVLVESATSYSARMSVGLDEAAAPATKGIMQGSNCLQPLFKFSRALNNNPSTLVDVAYEIKFWRVAP